MVIWRHTEGRAYVLEVPPNFTIDFDKANVAVIEVLRQNVHHVVVLVDSVSLVFKPK